MHGGEIIYLHQIDYISQMKLLTEPVATQFLPSRSISTASMRIIFDPQSFKLCRL